MKIFKVHLRPLPMVEENHFSLAGGGYIQADLKPKEEFASGLLRFKEAAKTLIISARNALADDQNMQQYHKEAFYELYERFEVVLLKVDRGNFKNAMDLVGTIERGVTKAGRVGVPTEVVVICGDIELIDDLYRIKGYFDKGSYSSAASALKRLSSKITRLLPKAGDSPDAKRDPFLFVLRDMALYAHSLLPDEFKSQENQELSLAESSLQATVQVDSLIANLVELEMHAEAYKCLENAIEGAKKCKEVFEKYGQTSWMHQAQAQADLYNTEYRRLLPNPQMAYRKAREAALDSLSLIQQDNNLKGIRTQITVDYLQQAIWLNKNLCFNERYLLADRILIGLAYEKKGNSLHAKEQYLRVLEQAEKLLTAEHPQYKRLVEFTQAN